MPESFPNPEAVMRRALELARRGEGLVEPNPMVGAVLVDDQLRPVGEGWHERFGEPHAEVHALRQAGEQARGATLFVTLEPCCHFGKTPPCSRAIIQAGVRRVVVAMPDPAPHVSGGGIAELRAAGIEVEVGLLGREAARLAAPFVTLMTRGRPFLHAKWAMTLDGKIAARTGASRWISSEASRQIVQRLRGRMDAVMVGIGTALADDPLLTARPPGPRTALRIVVDSTARLPLDAQLVRTVDQAPLLLATTAAAAPERIAPLREAGVDVLTLPAGDDRHPDLTALVDELGRRRLTNVLIEGGSRLLGACFDRGLIDAVHAFIAPKLVGGADAPTPLAGHGLPEIPPLPQLDAPQIEIVDGDIYLHGPLRRSS